MWNQAEEENYLSRHIHHHFRRAQTRNTATSYIVLYFRSFTTRAIYLYILTQMQLAAPDWNKKHTLQTNLRSCLFHRGEGNHTLLIYYTASAPFIFIFFLIVYFFYYFLFVLVTLQLKLITMPRGTTL